mgnify:CR=1
MKNFLLALMVVLTTCTLAVAQTTVVRDSIGKVKVTVTKDNKANTNNTAVTVIGVDTADADSADVNANSSNVNTTHGKASFTFDSDDSDFPFHNVSAGGGILVAIIAIIAVFGFPVFILFVIFFFRYKNRKARYRLAEQALAAGQPLPEGFIRESKPTDQRTQGIRNTFTGIGLFIFLWAITGEFGIGAIGLLVMFMGIGQWLVGYKQQNNQESTYRTSFTDREKNGRNTGTGNFNTRFTEEKNEAVNTESESATERNETRIPEKNDEEKNEENK